MDIYVRVFPTLPNTPAITSGHLPAGLWWRHDETPRLVFVGGVETSEGRWLASRAAMGKYSVRSAPANRRVTKASASVPVATAFCRRGSVYLCAPAVLGRVLLGGPPCGIKDHRRPCGRAGPDLTTLAPAFPSCPCTPPPPPLRPPALSHHWARTPSPQSWTPSHWYKGSGAWTWKGAQHSSAAGQAVADWAAVPREWAEHGPERQGDQKRARRRHRET